MTLRPLYSACLSGALGATLFLVACGSKQSAVGAGGECFLATDCAPGLVCIEKADKTRACSSDLSRVTGKTPEAAEDAAVEGGDAEARRVDADSGAPPRDGSVVDTFVPDTGNPDDGGDQ